jgi:hypothetical protein
MNRLLLFAALCFSAIFIGAFYTLVDGIICESGWGVTLSIATIITLFIAVRLLKNMLTAPADE